MQIVKFGIVLFSIILFLGCEDGSSNVHNNISKDTMKNVPHPLPASSSKNIENEDDFPPIAPII